MKCMLCGDDTKLIEAHIIPYWAYRYINRKDKKVAPLLLLGPKHNKKSAKGLYDTEILCKNCDGFLGIFDSYGKAIFVNRPIEAMTLDNEVIGYLMKNVDYKKIQIFILSVLWRASISKKEELKATFLGPYEIKIRNLLFNLTKNMNVENELSNYPVIVTKFGDGKFPDLVDRSIMLPYTKQRIEQVLFASIFLPRGFKISIKTDKRLMPPSLTTNLTKNGDLIILKINDFEKSADFRAMQKVLHKDTVK